MRRILGSIGLFLSMWGFGVMMQPRQVNLLTGTHGRACFWSAVLALLATVSVSVLTSHPHAARGKQDPEDGS